jgi:uncharacterized phage protein (TIGR02218 family)
VRTLTPELIAHFAGVRNGWKADLWTITLASGTVLRWTGADTRVVWAGQTYALGPVLARGPVAWTMGLDPDELELSVTPRPEDVIGSTTLRTAIRRGDFDGASVVLMRAYGAVPGTVIGVVEDYFSGHVGSVEGDGITYTLGVRSPLALLDRMFPGNVVQPACPNRLFDATCGLNPSTWRVTGTVTGSIAVARNQFAASALTQAAGYYRYGRLRFTSGPNAGRSLTVRDHAAGGLLTFAQPWPDAVAIGNAFEVWPGCDKRRETCIGKFNNLPRFRGAPFVPAAETTQ